MDFTVTLSEKFGVLPFEIFKQDKDEVIMLINYYVEKGNTEGTTAAPQPARKNDGFWDF